MFKENALERMVFELDGFPKYGLVYARICNIDNNGTILKESMNCKEEKVFMSNIIGACFLYRREVYERIGNYDTTLFLVEDYDYWLRIAEQFSIHYIPETLYFYRRHEESLSETRKEIVRKQLWKLMDKHFLILMEKFKNNERMRYQIYFAFREQGYNCGLHNDKLLQYLPQLTKVQKDVPQKPVIVFGAGYYGELFYNIFKNKISYFADNNIEKVGTSKKGIEIISFAEMIMKKEEMDIVIAVDSEKLYPMMMQLIAAGGNGFYVMQEVMMLMNEN